MVCLVIFCVSYSLTYLFPCVSHSLMSYIFPSYRTMFSTFRRPSQIILVSTSVLPKIWLDTTPETSISKLSVSTCVDDVRGVVCQWHCLSGVLFVRVLFVRGVVCQGVVCQGVVCQGCCLSGCCLSGCCLSGCCLSGVLFVRGVVCQGVVCQGVVCRQF